MGVFFALLAAVAGLRGASSVESFDYPDGATVVGQTGGTGWVGPWTAPSGPGTILIESGSLTYPGIVSSGGKMHLTGVAGSTVSVTSFRTNAAPLTNGTHYLRFMAQNLNGSYRYFGVALLNGSTEMMLVGQGSGHGSWTANRITNAPNNTNILISAVASTSPALLVLKLELRDGLERVTFWVNPDLSQPENPATAVGGGAFETDRDFGQITRIRIGGGGYSATAGGETTEHYLDEIRLDTVSPFTLPPPPLTWSGSAGSLRLSWPENYLGWILQAQTNGLAKGISANWTDLEGANLVITTNIPIQPGNPAMFFRLRQP